VLFHFRLHRTLYSLIFFFSACGLAGALLNERLDAKVRWDQSQLAGNLRAFARIYRIVKQNYADPISGKKAEKVIYDGAIPYMLSVLDPHSTFYDPQAWAKTQEEQRAKYYGVGMVIKPQEGSIIVEMLFEDAPAFKAGVRPGDVISDVDGRPIENMASNDVASMLKGPKGTHVKITIVREGVDKPLTFAIVRDEIHRNSIDLTYLIRPGIGYIHLANFQATTGQEVAQAIDGFGDLKGLVFDLRNNPGGLLSEAVKVSDKLLRKGQLIISQQGRAYPEQTYRATHGNGGHLYPVVVLVNHGTASAAEIVSGALQDHDRALIVGQTTFGKGLVQTVYGLSANTGLHLTTYRYYTPSGRLIQRNYNGVSLYDYYYGQNTKESENKREVKLTDSGRLVYGGGGIAPDEIVEPPPSNHFQGVLVDQDIFAGFTKHYLANRNAAQDFQVDDAVLSEFRRFLSARHITYTDQDLNGVTDWLKVNIKADVITTEFGQTEGLMVRANWDPMIEKALGYLPQAQALEENANQVLAQGARPRLN